MLWVFISSVSNEQQNRCFHRKVRKMEPFSEKKRILTLNAAIATTVVCFSRLLKCLRSLHGKQCGPRSDCSVCSGPRCLLLYFNLSVMLDNYLQHDFSRRHFSDTFFLGALRVNVIIIAGQKRMLRVFTSSVSNEQHNRSFHRKVRKMEPFSEKRGF